MIWLVLTRFIIGILVFCLSFIWILRIYLRHLKKQHHKEIPGTTIGIFHPYCNAGGGGERVLWCAVRAIQEGNRNVSIIIYTGDHVPPETLISNAEKRFNVIIEKSIKFEYLQRRRWVEAAKYPILTLLGQSLGSFLLGFEALFLHVPDVYIDTMGYAFTFPLFKVLGGAKIGCYVHYPTISTDMLARVAINLPAYNNSGAIARSRNLSSLKLGYYKLFAILYGFVGRFADIVMVNSSWTENHINSIWNISLRTNRVYPPCDVSEFLKIKQIPDSEKRIKSIVAVAQFRPEKDHPLMIMSYFSLLQVIPDELKERVRFIFVGSCRDEIDEKRVEDYKDLCKHLSIEDYVEFRVNVTFEELKTILQEGTIGIHTMWNEHFGISVVECMAAGLIMVAHNSGGPKSDIIVNSGHVRNGFLAEYEDEYSSTILKILNMSDAERQEIREAAWSSVGRFSDAKFQEDFLRNIAVLLET
ncbi:GDP-Man:Man(3)GlcNAc(2)-PP-Dol alpha-1,2-mannosyltransferase-like isoform X2 [Artemia franciscana]|uniref:GDP-Man:Man(3)GlcNAc(2)-PP-Dol alpha-1,2-mannosyltransferase-like isoform X2 n=1 Tax=Artemia franciscana TaxID=6661 RepID=UPI0032DA41CC